MATPLSAAAATTRTKTHANARLPFRTVFSRRRWVLLAGHRRFAALLPPLSKFREISWGRFFPERKRGATTTTRRNILLPLTNYSFRPRSFFSWGGIFEGKRGRDKFSFLFFLLSRRGESRMEEKTRDEFFEIEKAIFSYSFLFCRGLYFETMFHVEKRISGCRTGTKKRIFQRLGLGKRVGKF